jgi:hypothetical protein
MGSRNQAGKNRVTGVVGRFGGIGDERDVDDKYATAMSAAVIGRPGAGFLGPCRRENRA